MLARSINLNSKIPESEIVLPKLNSSLSVVVPAYGQEKTIAADLTRIRSTLSGFADHFEIVLVVDGRVDETAAVASALDFEELTVHLIENNRGKGNALRAGFRMVSGDIVGYLDAGMDIDPAAIAVASNLVENGGADIAIGSKRHVDSEVIYPLRRRIYSFGYQSLVKMMFDLEAHDTQVGLKFMRRELAQSLFADLKVDGFSIDIELLALAVRRGFDRIVECPVGINLDFPSSVTASTVRHMLLDTIRGFWRMRVLDLYPGHPTRGDLWG